MNIKRILSAVTAFGIIATSVPAFAADSDFFEFGTPYDLTTGEYTSELVQDHVIAIPVDVLTTTNGLTAWSVGVEVTDSSLLKIGTNDLDLTDTEYDNLSALGAVATTNDVDYAVNAIGTWRRGSFTPTGCTFNVNPAYSIDGKSIFFVEWALTSATTTSVIDGPEGYIICDVLKDSSDDELNKELLSLTSEVCRLSDTGNGKGNTINIAAQAPKANACDGAFKVVVDSEALPYWVQGVTANIGGQDYALDAALNEDGTTSYSFPVRVTSAAEEASVDATIKATVSDDEAGSTNSREVEWGTVTVDMTGTVTDYAQADASIN